MKNFLVIDAGNTSTTVALFKEDGCEIKHTYPLRGGIRENPMCGEALTAVLKAAEDDGVTLDGAMMASVTPAVNELWRKLVKEKTSLSLCFVSHDMKLPFTFDYPNPETTGADRIANVAAGVLLHGTPALIIDIGTAITYEVVSKDKRFFTGVIAPGPEMVARAFHDYTALLPYVEWWKAPAPKIPSDTEGAMRYGIEGLFIGGLKETVLRILPLIDKDAKLVATGGHGASFASELGMNFVIDRELTLRGIGLLALLNAAKPRRVES